MVYVKMKMIWGSIVIGINNSAKITGLWFDGQKYFPKFEAGSLWVNVIGADDIEYDEQALINREVQATIHAAVIQLREYEQGERKVFDLPLELAGTEFRMNVWDILKDIPYGCTETYGNVGKKIAAKTDKISMSAQAVGGAVGHNPISIIVPCHRVIGANGQLVGYAGGIDKKEALLAHENYKK